MNEYAKKSIRKWVVTVLLAIGMMIAASVICSGSNDLSGPEWDRYYGCLEIQQDWGQTKSKARDICKQYRP